MIVEKIWKNNQVSLVEAKYVPIAMIINAIIKIADGNSLKIIRDKAAPIKGEIA